MEKQNHNAPLVSPRKRNKETAKAELIKAVGKVLVEDGYVGLKIGNVARHAGYDDNLVRSYFGSFDNLLDHYLASKDFWTPVFQNVAVLTDTTTKAELQGFLTSIFSNLLDSLVADVEMQQLMLWNISESVPSLKDLETPWEEQMSRVVSVSNCKSETELRAFLALLYGGIRTNVFAGSVGVSLFGKLDVTNEQDLKEMHEIVGFLIDHAIRNLGAKT